MKKEEQEHVLLAESLRDTLSLLTESPGNSIARALVMANMREESDYFEGEPKVSISDVARMLAIRKPEPGQEPGLGISYLPKGKQPKILDNGNWAKDNRQITTPGKVARALLEQTKLYHEVTQVKFHNRWCNYEPTLGIISYKNKGQHQYFTATDDATRAQYASLPMRLVKVPVQRYSDKAYEDFGNSFKASQECVLEFKLVSGADIPKYYSQDEYYVPNIPADDADYDEGLYKGTLWESCMRESCWETFNLYKNCPNCKMLVAFKDGLVAGRALVWTTDKGILMDRVYSYEDYYVNKFIMHAKEQGWMYKKEQQSCSDFTVMAKAESGEYEFVGYRSYTISDVGVDHRLYPYLDTFKYLLPNGTLTNDVETDWLYELEGTDGEVSEDRDDDRDDDDDTVTCAITGDELDIDDCHHVWPIGWVTAELTTLDWQGSRIVTATAVTLPDGELAGPTDPNLVVRNDNVTDVSENCHRLEGIWYSLDVLEWCDKTNVYLFKQEDASAEV